MKKLPSLETPLNANERYLYAIAIRMDAMCSMMASFIECYAKKNEIATTSEKIEEKVSNTEEVAETVVEVVEEKPKRTRKK